MDFLRASGRAAGLSLHPLQPADSSHVCTLRRPSPGWRTLPAPMPTGLTTCSGATLRSENLGPHKCFVSWCVLRPADVE